MKRFNLISIFSIAILATIPIVHSVVDNHSVAISSLSTSNVQAFSEGNDYRKFYINYEVRANVDLSVVASGNNQSWEPGSGIAGIIGMFDSYVAEGNLTLYTVSFTISCETCKKIKANCIPQLTGRYEVNDDGSIEYVG